MADKDRRYTPEQIIEWWKCCSKQSTEHHCMKCPVQEDCIDVTHEPEDFYKHIALRASELLHDVMEREKPKWINVKDRKPDAGSIVVALIRKRIHNQWRECIEVLLYDPEMYQPIWGEVTHWMLIPDLPEPTQNQFAGDQQGASVADGGGLAHAT